LNIPCIACIVSEYCVSEAFLGFWENKTVSEHLLGDTFHTPKPRSSKVNIEHSVHCLHWERIFPTFGHHRGSILKHFSVSGKTKRWANIYSATPFTPRIFPPPPVVPPLSLPLPLPNHAFQSTNNGNLPVVVSALTAFITRPDEVIVCCLCLVPLLAAVDRSAVCVYSSGIARLVVSVLTSNLHDPRERDPWDACVYRPRASPGLPEDQDRKVS
jgi:hypothetical protein